MEILDKCEDDNFFIKSSEPVRFPTNTYYPPGIVKNQLAFFLGFIFKGRCVLVMFISSPASTLVNLDLL